MGYRGSSPDVNLAGFVSHEGPTRATDGSAAESRALLRSSRIAGVSAVDRNPRRVQTFESHASAPRRRLQ